MKSNTDRSRPRWAGGLRLLLVTAVFLLLGAFTTMLALAAPTPTNAEGELSDNTVQVGTTVNETLTISATNGEVKYITITAPAGWVPLTVGSIQFFDGSTTSGVSRDATVVTNTAYITLTPPVSFTAGTNNDELRVNFSFTAPQEPVACGDGEFTVRVGAANSSSVGVTNTTAGPCGNGLQVQVHHGPVTQFQIEAPVVTGVVTENLALVDVGRPITITALDSFGNVADGEKGGDGYYTKTVELSTPGLSGTTWSGPSLLSGNQFEFGLDDNGVITATMTTAAAGLTDITVQEPDGSPSDTSDEQVRSVDPQLSVTSDVHGGSDEDMVINGTGNWGPQNWTIKSNTIVAGDSSTQHSNIVVQSDNQFGNRTIKRTDPLPTDDYDITVVVSDSTTSVWKYTKTFADVFSVTPDVPKFDQADEDGNRTGNGEPNDDVNMIGTGFNANVVPPTVELFNDSFTASVPSFTHSTEISGNFGGEITINLPALPRGVYDLRIDDFNDIYEFTDIDWTVEPTLVLTPTLEDGLSGLEITLRGNGFEGGQGAGDVTVTVGGVSTSGTVTTTTDGILSGTVTLDSDVAPGVHDVVVQTTNYTETFADAFNAASAEIDPATGTGAGPQSVEITGSYYLSDTVVTGASLGTGTESSFSVASDIGSSDFNKPIGANGLLTLTNSTAIAKDLPRGTYALSMTVTYTPTATGVQLTRTLFYPDAFEVAPTLTLTPSQVVRDRSTPFTVDVKANGLDESGTVVANSITIGGESTTHNSEIVSNGEMEQPDVELQNVPAGGQLHDVVIPIEAGNTFTFADAFGVADVTADPITGTGQANVPIMLSGSGFLSGTVIAQNTISFTASYTTSHMTVTVGADGTFSTQITPTSYMPAGMYTVTIPVDNDGQDPTLYFDNEFAVEASAELDPMFGDGRAANVDQDYPGATAPLTTEVAGFGFDPDEDVDQVLFGSTAVTITTGSDTDIKSNGRFTVTVELDALSRGSTQDVSVVTTDGVTHTNLAQYHVASLTLTQMARSFNEDFSLSGSNFLPSAELTGTVKFIRKGDGQDFSATEHSENPIQTDAGGNISGQINLSTGSLPAGTYGIEFTLEDENGETIDYFFADVFTSGASQFGVLSVSPAFGDGLAGNTTTLTGSNLDPDETIPANSITVGGQATTHSSKSTTSTGALTVSLTLPALPPGKHDVVVTTQDGKVYTGTEAYTVVDLQLSPTASKGDTDELFEITGSNFPANGSFTTTVDGPIDAPVDLVNGTNTSQVRSNASGQISADISFPYLPQGMYALTLGNSNYTFQFADVFTVTPGIDVSPDTISNESQSIDVSGTGFDSNEQVAANSITVEGETFLGRSVAQQATTHDAFQINVNGSFDVEVTVPALEPGNYSLNVAGETFANAITVIGEVDGSVTINGGDASTSSRNVTLTLTRTESVDQVAVSEDPTALQTAPAWINYPASNELAFSLSEGSGEKTVYAIFRNSATDARSDLHSDSIVLVGSPATVFLSASPSTVTADGSSTSTITARVVDSNGSAVPGQQVNFNATLGTLSSATATTDANGEASVTLTSDSVGTAEVSATAGAASSSVVNVAFVAAPPANVSVQPADAELEANGTDSTEVVITVTDASDNPVAGAVVDVTTSLGSVSPSQATTNAQGQATVTLTAGTETGTATITATSGDASGTATVEFVEPSGEEPVIEGDLFIPLISKEQP